MNHSTLRFLCTVVDRAEWGVATSGKWIQECWVGVVFIVHAAVVDVIRSI